VKGNRVEALLIDFSPLAVQILNNFLILVGGEGREGDTVDSNTVLPVLIHLERYRNS
jgi:hypothetical protein